MSTNMGISSTGGSAGIERVPTVVAIPKSDLGTNPQSNGASNRTHANLHSAKEVRRAEIQGNFVPIGEEQLIIAIEKANKAMQGINTSFEFSIHEGTKEIMVKVLDKDTGKVVREIPSEKILDMVARLWEMSGIFVDEKR